MALFNKNTTEETGVEKVASQNARPAQGTARNTRVTNDVLLAPRVTEKAARLTEQNVYVFNVTLEANKVEVKKAIEDMYKVTPEKVRIVSIPRKSTFYRGRRGMTNRGKKAYVYLKKGDSITVV